MAEKDLVTRLRASDGFTTFRASDGLPGVRVDIDLMCAAADEIERLRAQLKAWSGGFERLRRLDLPGEDGPEVTLMTMAADRIERLMDGIQDAQVCLQQGDSGIVDRATKAIRQAKACLEATLRGEDDSDG